MAKRAKVFVEIEISMNTFAVREEVEKALQVRLGVFRGAASTSTTWMWSGATVLMIVPQEDKPNA